MSLFISEICFILTVRYADMFGSSGIRSTASHQRPLVADFRMPFGAVSGVGGPITRRVLGPELHGRLIQLILKQE